MYEENERPEICANCGRGYDYEFLKERFEHGRLYCPGCLSFFISKRFVDLVKDPNEKLSWTPFLPAYVTKRDVDAWAAKMDGVPPEVKQCVVDSAKGFLDQVIDWTEQPSKILRAEELLMEASLYGSSCRSLWGAMFEFTRRYWLQTLVVFGLWTLAQALVLLAVLGFGNL